MESALVFLVDAMVGVMKFALAVFSVCEAVFFGVEEGEPPPRRFLLAAFEVISIRVPMVK